MMVHTLTRFWLLVIKSNVGKWHTHGDNPALLVKVNIGGRFPVHVHILCRVGLQRIG